MSVFKIDVSVPTYLRFAVLFAVVSAFGSSQAAAAVLPAL